MTLLEKVKSITQERQQHYGSPLANFTEIAKRWSLTLKTPVTPAQVALCMIDLKISRLSHNSTHADSLLDIIGYANCFSQIQAQPVQCAQTQRTEEQYEMAL